MSLREGAVEALADRIDALPFDTLELRNWGEEGVADPYHIIAIAALDALCDYLTGNVGEIDTALVNVSADDWAWAGADYHRRWMLISEIVAVLRESSDA